MKRLTTLILTTLIALGMFLPVAVSLSNEGVSVQESTVSAATTPQLSIVVSPSNPTPGSTVTLTLTTTSTTFTTIDGTNTWTVNGTPTAANADGSLTLVLPATGTTQVSVTLTPTDTTTWNTASTSTTINPAATSADQNIKDASSDCGLGIFGDSTMGGCLESFFYYIPYSLGGWFLARSAQVLDISAAYTLSSRLYSASQFIVDGWRVTRDFSNIFFIFVLLAIAIMMILGLGTGHANPKKMLVSVVLVALLINFSMFFTEVLIDTSNTVALLFYNQITVTNSNGAPSVDKEAAAASANTGLNGKDVAAALAQAFHPQVFQSATFFSHLPQDPNTHKPSVTTMIMILLCVGGIFCVGAYSFFIAGLSLIGRLIQLMVCIVFAPFAMMSLIIPGLSGVEGIGWKGWWKSLASAAFGAPIYFFFILLISIMAGSPLITQATAVSATDSITTLLTLLISFIILTVMLLKATAFAKKSAGEAGAAITSLGMNALKTVSGFAIGSAVGATGFVGRNTVGIIGDKASKSETLRDLSVNGNKLERSFARFAINTGRGAANASFDATNTAAGKQFQSSFGVKLKTIPGIKSITPAANRGGYVAQKKRKDERNKKFAESLEYDKKKQTAIDGTVANFGKAIEQLTDEIQVAKAKFGAQSPEVIGLTEQISTLKNGVKESSKNETWTLADVQAQKAKLGGGKVTLKDVGQFKNKWNEEDTELKDANGNIIREAKKRADGTKVTMEHVNAGELRTEAMGAKELQKIAEGNKKNRANSYMHLQMKKTGYAIKNTKRDALGNMTDAGYLDTHEASHRMRAIADEVLKSTGAFGTTGAVVGTAGFPGIGTVIGGGAGATVGVVNGLINGFKKELVANSTGKAAASGPAAGIKILGNNVGPSTFKHATTMKGFKFAKPSSSGSATATPPPSTPTTPIRPVSRPTAAVTP